MGQIAAERKPVLLRNISREEATGQTGTLSEPPRSIYAIPLLYENNFYGVLEVASFEEIDSLKTEHLDAAGPVIAAYLYASLQSMKIKDLLDDTRSKNDELTALNDELKSQAEELEQQTLELKEQAEELEAQRLQVQEADKLKSEFLSNMSHELRTPLNSVMALSELMLSRGTGIDPAQDAEYLTVIERNGRRLLNLINDILDLSKIESGRVELALTDFNPLLPSENALETTRPLAEAKGLEIQSGFDEVPRMYSDADKVQQILTNLLSNAIKFTREGKIELAVTSTGDEVLFSVKDTGIGIPDSEQPKVFDEFRQVDGSTTREYEGTGLGLAISQKYAGLLDGEIRLESIPGRGSTFTLVLPVRLDNDQKAKSRAGTGPAQKMFANSGTALARTVLVIDDEPQTCDLLGEHLRKAGYDVVTAGSGSEGLQLARQVRPFAITLDILMPDMDGWEVLRRLKSSSVTADIPVIIVSVSDDRTTGTALGATGCITKPVDRELILAEIDKIAALRPVQQILVVDDNQASRLSLESLLTEKNYTVIQADGGLEGISIAQKEHPDAIILDLLMPGMDGFTVLEKLKSDPGTEAIPVIILTAKDLTSNDRSRLERSVRRIIEKGGMQKQQLLQEIEAALAGLQRQAAVKGSGILVVEDNDVAALQIRTALEENGFSVSVASNGAEGLESIKRRLPEAIVLDLMMPGIDGFEVLEKVRSSSLTAGLPILILTAKELTGEERSRLKRNNIQQLIQKGSFDRDQLVASVKRMLEKETDRPLAVPPAPKHPQAVPAGSGRTVLVVEDNPDNLFTITAILKGTQYGFITAENGEKAVSMTREHQPGLILMDIQLPVLGGLDAAKQIKSDAGLAHIPIVALMAKAMKGDRELIMASGCDDYLSKPVDPDALIKIVRKWLG